MRISENVRVHVAQVGQKTEIQGNSPNPGEFHGLFEDQLRSVPSAAEAAVPMEPTSSVFPSSTEPPGIFALEPAEDSFATEGNSAPVHSLAALDEGLHEVEQLVVNADLKSMGRAIDGLSKEAHMFSESTKDLPSGHPLRQAAEELNVLAYVESLKWNRGDYL